MQIGDIVYQMIDGVLCLRIKTQDGLVDFYAFQNMNITDQCNHEYVDIGFVCPKWVCKKCDQEK